MINNDWPALAGVGIANSLERLATIEIKKGIFGKVDGARTDYRYIACSPGFDQDRQLKNVSYFGASDISEDFLAWSVHNNIARAIHVYPSKARDADNRGVGFEKHILEIDITQVPDGVLLPYALALLDKAQQYKDELWWEQRSDSRWNQDVDFYVEMEHEPPISIEDINQAQKKLVATVEELSPQPFSKSLLTSFYNQILSNQLPILLTEIATVVPAEKILALFLPLEINHFKGKSFTTYFPSKRVKSEVLKDAWDILPIPGKEIGQFKAYIGQTIREVDYFIEAMVKNDPLFTWHGNNATKSVEDIDEQKEVVNNNGLIAAETGSSQQNTIIQELITVLPEDRGKIRKTTIIKSTEEKKKLGYIIPRKKPLMSGRLFLVVAEQEFEKLHPIIEDAYRFLHSECQYIETKSRFSYQLTARNADNIPQEELDLLTSWLTKLQKYADTKYIDIKWKIDFFCALYIFILQEQSSLEALNGSNTFSNELPLLWLFYKLGDKQGFSRKCNLRTLQNTNPKFLENILNQTNKADKNLFRKEVLEWLHKNKNKLATL